MSDFPFTLANLMKPTMAEVSRERGVYYQELAYQQQLLLRRVSDLLTDLEYASRSKYAYARECPSCRRPRGATPSHADECQLSVLKKAVEVFSDE